MKKLLLIALIFFSVTASADNYYSFDGVDDEMTGLFTSSYADPISFGLILRFADHPVAAKAIMQLGNSNNSHNDSYMCRFASTDNQFSIVSFDSGGATNAATATKTGIDNTWVQLLCIVTNDTNDRDVYIEDVTGANANTRAVANAINDIIVGSNLPSTDWNDIDVAYVAVWDIALDSTQQSNFLGGTCPEDIAASDLVGFWPLQTNNSTQANEGVDAGGDLSVSGATFQSGGGPGYTDCGAVASAPAFDTGLSCSATDTNTFNCTYDADALADTIFICAKIKDSTAPADGAAIEAGTGCSGTATEAATGASDNISVDVTGGDPLPVHDIYGILEEGVSNYSTQSIQLDELLVEPTGRNYFHKSGSPGGGELGIFDGASPAAVDGDTGDVSECTDSFGLGVCAHTLTVAVDTTYEIDTDGDLTRQLFTRRFADWSLGAWSDATAQPYAVNDLAPIYVFPEFVIHFAVNETLDHPLDASWLDPENDSMTHEVTNMPSGGAILDQETITGAFDTCGAFPTVSLKSTDQYGEFTSQTVTFEVGANVPDVVGDDEATAVAAIEALCSLTALSGPPEYSDTIPAGQVISTSPDANELVSFDATVTYIISLGEEVLGDFTIVNGRAVTADGTMVTIPLADGVAVPGTAIIQNGIAIEPDGRVYIAACPDAPDISYYVRGTAVRSDGAMCYVEETFDLVINGLAHTNRGELSVTLDTPDLIVNGWGIQTNGVASVSNL